jgi:hypothetical protein
LLLLLLLLLLYRYRKGHKKNLFIRPYCCGSDA